MIDTHRIGTGHREFLAGAYCYAILFPLESILIIIRIGNKSLFLFRTYYNHRLELGELQDCLRGTTGSIALLEANGRDIARRLFHLKLEYTSTHLSTTSIVYLRHESPF